MLHYKRIKYIKDLVSKEKFVVYNELKEIKAIFVTEAEAVEYINFKKKNCFLISLN
jgi:hypothetical protein